MMRSLSMRHFHIPLLSSESKQIIDHTNDDNNNCHIIVVFLTSPKLLQIANIGMVSIYIL